MKKVVLYISCFIAANSINAQNVGIGVDNPLAKLHVAGVTSSSQAMFGLPGGNGISINVTNPVIGFNLYRNGVNKFMGNGYAGMLFLDAFTGRLFYNATPATGTADATASPLSLFVIQPDGNVGIGTTSPTEAKLQVHDAAGNTQFIAAAGSNLPGISTFVPASSPSLGFNARYSNGYKFMGDGYGGFWQFSPAIGRLDYYYSSTRGLADGVLSGAFAMTIDSNGRLGIGTSTPKAPLHVTGNIVFGSSSIVPATGYKVSVDGKIICEDIVVQDSGSWPDYVFGDDYDFPSLDSLESIVMTTKHLPGIPSASDPNIKQGIALGDMQKHLLEKIEELYRYMFELNKENKLLKAELKRIGNSQLAIGNRQ